MLLEALRVGAPISGEEGVRILNPGFANAISPAARAVVRARGLMPSRVREVYWITGRPGNGKTQSLHQFIYQLPKLEGAGKYAFAALNFDREPEARRLEALVPALVRHSLAGGLITEVHEVSQHILQGSAADETAKESISFGIDILSQLAGLPAISLFATAGLKQLLGIIRAREWYIKKKLSKKWSANPQLLELLNGWVRYVLSPTPDREEEFTDILRRLNNTGNLFDLFCFALAQARYSTLVLVFDEVDAGSLTSLKPLWDVPDHYSGFYHELNLVFVISAKENVRERAEDDEALRRRFCSTIEGHHQLTGPRINALGNDDFDHVVKKVEELLNDAHYLRRAGFNQQVLTELRRELSEQAVISWQILWERVINVMVSL